jgi:5-formyltetrahydrofolate cyclo-ligase
MNCAKRLLRQQFLHQRRSLTIDLWQTQSDLLCDRLTRCPQFIEAQTILAYQSCRQEPSLDYLFTHTDKQWGLPRCVVDVPRLRSAQVASPAENRELVWHRWQPSATLVTGRYGIREPAPETPLLLPGDIDLMLVPAVAIDRHGYRLGYGGGYYDRLHADPVWRKIPTIGIVFDFAYVEQLPIEPWDLPLDAVCTELGIIYF